MKWNSDLCFNLCGSLRELCRQRAEIVIGKIIVDPDQGQRRDNLRHTLFHRSSPCSCGGSVPAVICDTSIAQVGWMGKYALNAVWAAWKLQK